jgi:hypothetical protein
MYDLEKLSWRVESRRRKFKILAAVYSIAALIGLALCFINKNQIRMWGFILLMAGVFLLIHLINKYSPSLLFSPDVNGISIKEHEYVAAKVARAPTGRVAIFRNSGGGSNSGNAKAKRPHVRAATVYVRLEDGEVATFDGLTSIQTDIYEIGDELLRPSGARYPIILNRDAEKQPCPWCGRINVRESFECESCGLSIIPKKN